MVASQKDVSIFVTRVAPVATMIARYKTGQYAQSSIIKKLLITLYWQNQITNAKKVNNKKGAGENLKQ